MAALISRSISLRRIGIRGCRLDDLAPRLDFLVAQRLVDLVLVAIDPGRGEVAKNLADDVMIAGFLEIGADDVLRIGFGFGFGQAHLPRRPMAEQPVAPGGDAEHHLLVVRELGLESAFAVVKLASCVPLCSLRRR